MSSQRFPYEGPPAADLDGVADLWPVDHELGAVQAEDQAALDRFLHHAERERRRLEARVVEAEQRCRAAEADLVQATLEHQAGMEDLYATWEHLRAERDRRAGLVEARLREVRAAAEELARWGAHAVAHEPAPWEHAAPVPVPAPPAAAPPAPVPAPAPAVVPDRQPATTAAPGFADAADFAEWARLDEPMPTVHDELLARHPRRRAQGDGDRGSIGRPAPTQAVHDDFWADEQAAAGALRLADLEGTVRSLVPMFALVVVLVALLAWVG